MKERVLLDTNMMIYILDAHVLDEKISKLIKILYDSDKYMITIHPNTVTESMKIKNEQRRKIFLSKLDGYKRIDNPPKMSEEFNKSN